MNIFFYFATVPNEGDDNMRITKILFLCLILLLACTSQAGLSEEQIFLDEQFPASYQTSFFSNTGKVEFKIDAAVEVPHVTNIPVYQASMRMFEPKEIQDLANVMLQNPQCLYENDGQWMEITEQTSVSRSFEIVYIPQYATRSTDSFDNWGDYVSGYYMTADDQVLVMNLYYTHTLPMDGVYYNLSDNMSGDAFDKPLTDNQIPGNHYTKQEAQALADQVISCIAPEMKLVSTCSTEASFYYSEEEMDRHNDPEDSFTIDPEAVKDKLVPAYVFTYGRELGGIPITYTTTNCSTYDRYEAVIDYEKCFVIVGNRSIEYVGYSNPMKCGSIIESSCKLLPFDEIISVATSVMPIQYDAIYSSPSYLDVSLHVDRITLGYMRVQVKDAQNAYALIPVWDFFGTGAFTNDRQEKILLGTSPNNSLFTVNAMDGTVIDRAYGY